MRRLGLAITTIALLAGTSAFAQSVTTVEGSGVNALFVDGTFTGMGDGSASQGSNRANFSAFHDTLGDPIVFESSNSLVGFNATNITVTEVEIGLSNPDQVNFQLQSTITAAGMGFYVASVAGGCALTGTCAENPASFDALAPTVADATTTLNGVTNVVALAQFNFDVFGVDARGTETLLYNRAGFTALRLASAGDIQTVGVMNTGQNGGVSDLLGFGQPDNDANSFTYTWDATNFSVNVSGLFSSLRYRSTVSTYTDADCIGPNASQVCIVSFAAFGDPIGRDGDADLQGFDLALLSLEDGGAQNLEAQLGAITGINGERANFTRPQFVGGNLYFQDVSTAAIPEPATWAMMIMGFGFLGTAMRRRRAFVRA